MAKKNKKQKKKLNQKSVAVLDTSFQLERIKFEEFEKNIDQLIAKYRVYSSSFSLYEFKVGVILSLVDYYFKVELCNDISKAKAQWSDRWGRDPKYQLILDSVMYRLNDSIPTKDIKKYLRQVEVAIITFIEIFNNKLLGMMGSFPNDPIVTYVITGRDSFQNFWDLYHGREIFPMKSFWDSNSESLNSLVQSTDLKKKYKKLHGHLSKISIDTGNSEKYITVNKGVGDAIIAVDCSKKHLLVTTDSSFDYLCPPLNKNHQKLPKI